jgi:hypothetical protein
MTAQFALGPTLWLIDALLMHYSADLGLPLASCLSSAQHISGAKKLRIEPILVEEQKLRFPFAPFDTSGQASISQGERESPTHEIVFH